jgi:polysaccharide biosynthesis/export protein
MSEVKIKDPGWVVAFVKALSQFGWVALLVTMHGQARGQEPVIPRTVSPISTLRPAISGASPANRVGQGYVISKDDLLDIYVMGVQELSREYRVNADGLITMPMLSRPVTAAGLTLDQLSMSIRKALSDAGLVKEPDVLVTLKSSTLNAVVLTGAVKKPGVYPIYGPTTLLELLTQAEGLSDDAGDSALITRGEKASAASGVSATQTGGVAQGTIPRVVNVNVLQLWQNGDATLDTKLYPGDRVMVERAGIVYVLGGVTRAGGFVLSSNQEQMTVLKAVALAGNFTREAKPRRAVILRKTSPAPSGRQEIPVDLKMVLANHAPDQRLLASDILYVPESGRKRALNMIVDAALVTTIWHVPY